MSKTRSRVCATLDRLCRQKYNKYGEWIDGQFILYDDMEKVCTLRH